MTKAKNTSGPTGWARNSNEVTTPKLPPPPCSAQSKSALFSLLAVRSSPSAVTTSAEMRLSQLSPYLRRSQPMPPASVKPAIPVSVTTPRYGQPECLRLVVELTNGDATFCPDCLGKRIDSNTLHQG